MNEKLTVFNSQKLPKIIIHLVYTILYILANSIVHIAEIATIFLAEPLEIWYYVIRKEIQTVIKKITSQIKKELLL